MKSILADFLNLLFPSLCIVCGENLHKQEQHLCINCLQGIPKTNYQLVVNNPIEKRFWGKVPINRGTAFFFFQKGSPYQKILHSLKYRGNQEVGELLGKYAAQELLESVDFSTIDIIIPVPLHPKKQKIRGYNQSECIGNGLSKILEKPIDNTSLIRVRENTTQTKKTVFERYENTDGIFVLQNQNNLTGKHVLLVDDVLTTGSTLEACIRVLIEIEGIKVSVFTLAVA